MRILIFSVLLEILSIECIQKQIHYGNFIGRKLILPLYINHSFRILSYHIIKEYTILSTLPPPLNLFGMTKHDMKPFNRKSLFLNR